MKVFLAQLYRQSVVRFILHIYAIYYFKKWTSTGNGVTVTLTQLPDDSYRSCKSSGQSSEFQPTINKSLPFFAKKGKKKEKKNRKRKPNQKMRNELRNASGIRHQDAVHPDIVHLISECYSW